jgi:hypothetical protein
VLKTSNLNSLPNIVRPTYQIKEDLMSMGKKRALQIVVEKSGCRRPLGKRMHGWEDIKMDHEEEWCNGAD